MGSSVGRKFVFWVVYDATGDRQFIKMDSETGCLAVFDNEESAAAFASCLFGVDYREVVLYSCPQPAPDVEALQAECEKLRMDAKRLDWIVSEGVIVARAGVRGEPHLYRVEWPQLSEVSINWSASERDAIDAAMRPSEQPECGCCGQTDRCDDDCDAVVMRA